MRALALLVVLLSGVAGAVPRRAQSPVLVATQFAGTHVLLGTVTATTTKNNHDTAVAFSNTGDALKGLPLQVQCDTAAYMTVGTVNTVTAATTTGVYLEAKAVYVLSMAESYGWIAFVASSGTSVCKVWQLI